MKPEWNETGEPINIQAAAADAMAWLQLLAVLIDRERLTLRNHDENRRRLGWTMDRLQKFLEIG